MFITFEGPDGSGKTTTICKLIEHLNEQKIDYILTREPGSPLIPLGKKLREIIVDDNYAISPMTEAILFMADRRQHLEQVIWPALKANKLILCDRYFDSSFAYQGYARKLGVNKIMQLNEIISDFTYPDLTIYFDVPQNTAKERMQKREHKNRLDQETEIFKSRVIEGYHQLIKRFPERFRVIDASQSAPAVFEQVKQLFHSEILKK